MSNVDNIVTFYVDNRIDNEFMRNAVSDVQAMSDTAISTTDSLVTKDSILLLLNVVPTTDSILLLLNIVQTPRLSSVGGWGNSRNKANLEFG